MMIMMRSMKVNRKDVVTNKKVDRNEMIRISISKDGVTSIDRNFNNGGRGIYVLKSSIKIGIEKKILQKNIKRFGGDISNILNELLKEAENGK